MRFYTRPILEKIRLSMETYRDDYEVEAFYFDFLHFYGTPYQTGVAGIVRRHGS